MEVALAVCLVVVTLAVLAAVVVALRVIGQEYAATLRAILTHAQKTQETTAETVKAVFSPAVIVPAEQPDQNYHDETGENRKYYPNHELDNFIPGSIDEIIGMGDGWLNPSSEPTIQMKPPDT